MRIISGKLKGRRIFAPGKLPVRPTTDQAKEGLFNILANHYNFKELSVLDLFSGIGSVSFEFASRGTTDITAVDNFYRCVKFVEKTAKELEVDIYTLKSDVFSFLKKPFKSYDLIFVDPPYDFSDEQFEEIVAAVFKNNFLNENGLLILEHSKHTKHPSHPNFIENRKYGSAVFSFYKNQ